jgi:hypothetical protein
MTTGVPYFQHPDGRRIYAMSYRMSCGSQIIVWLDAAGNDVNRNTAKADGRPVVTARPGDVLLNGGRAFQVASSEVWRYH